LYLGVVCLHLLADDAVEQRGRGGEAASEGVNLVRGLQEVDQGIDEKLQSQGMKLFRSTAPIMKVDESQQVCMRVSRSFWFQIDPCFDRQMLLCLSVLLSV
jgi:hypothetical protein